MLNSGTVGLRQARRLNLIADPLDTDGEDKHDERSKGDPKDR